MKNAPISQLSHTTGRLSLLRIIAFCLIALTAFPANAAFTFADHSVLATGKWVKISVTESGIHQITYETLRNWGFADPDKVRIYGYGGALLPEDFREKYTDDLPRIPVFRNTSRQTLLFYAQGPLKWTYNFSRKEFVHTNNCYSTKGYYFLTESNEPETPAELLPPGSGETTTVTTFDDYFLHESELASLGKTGRELYGEDFRQTNSQSFSFRDRKSVV